VGEGEKAGPPAAHSSTRAGLPDSDSEGEGGKGAKAAGKGRPRAKAGPPGSDGKGQGAVRCRHRRAPVQQR
jgi:hypothetical protein